MVWKRARRLLVVLALAGMPLVTTVRCDPYYGTIDVFRDDDDHHHGLVDVLIDDVFRDDCLFHHCDYYEDHHYYDEIVIFD